jgi:hypothetical protein
VARLPSRHQVWQSALGNTNKQVNHPIYNRRPIERPAEIDNEPLVRLKDELRHLPDAPGPSADYVALTADLFHAAATIYDSDQDLERYIAISSVFWTLL